jgi:hypothetical protein
MVQVQFRQGAWTQRVWLPFSRFALPSEQYAGRQNPFQPRAVRLSDGREMELLYARERVDLPAAVALEDFTLLTHAGGLIGMNSNVRDYVSQLRFREPSGAWSEPMQMRLNDPAVWKGYSFFQATWDAPAADDPGMNFTGCGIGTRGGVHVQLAGTAIAVLGMIYTFYVKPIIIRRRRLNVHEQLEQEEAQGLRGRARTARSAASRVTAATTSATEEF